MNERTRRGQIGRARVQHSEIIVPVVVVAYLARHPFKGGKCTLNAFVRSLSAQLG